MRILPYQVYQHKPMQKMSFVTKPSFSSQNPGDVVINDFMNFLKENNLYLSYDKNHKIAPFENALCVLTMDGATLKELFGQIASVHGEGLSGATLKIDVEGNLLEAKVNGRQIGAKKTYTVATIDYLAEGNDKMEAFRRASSKIFPKDALLRNLLLDYVKQCEQKGQFVTSQVEGRIKVSASN